MQLRNFCYLSTNKFVALKVCVIEPGNFIAGTSLYNADMVKAQSQRMWDGMDENVREAYGQDYFDGKTNLMLSYTTAGVSNR